MWLRLDSMNGTNGFVKNNEKCILCANWNEKRKVEADSMMNDKWEGIML